MGGGGWGGCLRVLFGGFVRGLLVGSLVVGLVELEKRRWLEFVGAERCYKWEKEYGRWNMWWR